MKIKTPHPNSLKIRRGPCDLRACRCLGLCINLLCNHFGRRIYPLPSLPGASARRVVGSLEATVHLPNARRSLQNSVFRATKPQLVSTWVLHLTCWPLNPNLHPILALFWPKIAVFPASSWPVWSPFLPPKGRHQVGISFCSPTCT